MSICSGRGFVMASNLGDGILPRASLYPPSSSSESSHTPSAARFPLPAAAPALLDTTDEDTRPSKRQKTQACLRCRRRKVSAHHMITANSLYVLWLTVSYLDSKNVMIGNPAAIALGPMSRVTLPLLRIPGMLQMETHWQPDVARRTHRPGLLILRHSSKSFRALNDAVVVHTVAGQASQAINRRRIQNRLAVKAAARPSQISKTSYHYQEVRPLWHY
jgi:hypothetical protein